MTYWRATDAIQGRICERRIFVAIIDARLLALDAVSGAACADFGQAGTVDLSRGVDLGEYQADTREYGVTSPPVVIGDLVVVGSAIGDNRARTLERGIVRAFDARTGALAWWWDPVPREPADPACKTWANDSAMSTGAANVWAQLSVDVARDLVLRFGLKNWLWYALLTILVISLTWVAWLMSQAIATTLLAMLAALVVAWLLTLGRKRLYVC